MNGADDVGRFAGHLLAAQEKERECVARVLHDDLGQQVAALSILASTLKRRIPPDDVESRQQADRIREKLIALAESMGRLSMELYPSVLEHAGIAAALRQLCDGFEAANGIRIEYKPSGDFRDVPFTPGLCLYRIAQEILASMARYASGVAPSIRLIRSGDRLEMCIADHGSNLFTGWLKDGACLELCVLQHRAKSIRGEVRLEDPQDGVPQLTISIAC